MGSDAVSVKPRLCEANDAGLEEVEVSAAVHLAFDKLQLTDLAFGLTVGPWQGDCRLDRRFVFGHAVGECGDKAEPGSADPGIKVSERLSANDALELQDDLSRLHQNGYAAFDRCHGDCLGL